MNNEKIMGFDHALTDIDKQIEGIEKQLEGLYVKRTEIENRAEQAKAYQTIEELIDNYNEKYHGSLVLMERFDAHELLSRYGLI